MKKVIQTLYVFAAIILLASCGNSGKKTNEKTLPKDIIKDATIKPTVNVYIENSGSMDGFVKKGNKFTTFVTTYLTNISILYTDNINLNYINSKIIPLGNNLNDFASKLDAYEFNKKGGNRGETNIFQLLDTILKITDSNEIAIFITDGIFSPGKNKDAQKYIVDQYNGIKKSMADYYKKHPNAAVIIYQLISEFNGTFYGRQDKPIPNTKEELPYYVWLIGDSKNLSELINKVPENKFKEGNGIQNVFSITGGPKEVDYAVKMGSGNFDLNKKDPKTTIDNLKKVTRDGGCSRSSGKVKFLVNANLSGFLLSDKYLSDTLNYQMNNKDYSLTISKSVSNNFGYTHQLKFESSSVHKGIISVKLKTQIPPWVEDINDDDGVAPVKGKTYGIKYQIYGVYEAFTISNDYYTEIKIKIN
ncbi:MAG TPA: hypothetical protein PLC87_11835 [Bacteroidales bacterium]|nr:hypothetical protein [Bacteroidales bacterium]